MNFKMMGRFVGKILLVEAVFMVPAMLISLWEQEYTAVRAFLWSLGCCYAEVRETSFMPRKAWPVWVSAGLL